MRALLDENGLDRRPHDINLSAWYYEEPNGLRIYFKDEEDTIFIGVIQWRSLVASLKRHDAAKKKRIKKPVGRSHRDMLRESGIVSD